METLNLAQFTGTEKYYSYPMGLKLTDGVKYLADKCKCYWLLDIIASYQFKHKDIPFQLWILTVKNNTGTVTMQEDTETPELVRQVIPYTDFPMDSVKVYCIDKVILSPSEY